MPNTSKNSKNPNPYKRPAPKPNKKPVVYLSGAAAVAVVILVAVLLLKPGAPAVQPIAPTAQPTVQTAASAAKTNAPAVQTQAPAAKTEAPAVTGGGIVIPVKDVTETATFYPITVDGVKMEALAVKAPDGTIRTALNTCQVCYDSGRGYYKQEGDVLVCQNCGNRFRTSDVEKVKGGCNPVPVLTEDKIVTDDTITISAEFLQKAKVLFSNWKR